MPTFVHYIPIATTVLAAVTLLPAVLGFVGTNVDRLQLPWVHNEGDGNRYEKSAHDVLLP